MRFLVAESRLACLPGLQLTVLSLQEHYAGHPIEVCLGPELHDQLPWFEKHAVDAQVRLESAQTMQGTWNIKPALLARTLREGAPSAVWIDSDVVVSAPLRDAFDAPNEVLLATEDMWFVRRPGGEQRARGWGLKPGTRRLKAVANSGVVRCGQDHLEFVEAWAGLLTRTDYLSAQTVAHGERPFYFVGDQDALTAMLESASWDHIKFQFIQRGYEILQCYPRIGISLVDRVRARGALTPLLHACGPKPWATSTGVAREPGPSSNPYVVAAARWRDAISDAAWIPPAQSLTSRYPLRRGAADAAVACLPLLIKSWVGRLRRRMPNVLFRLRRSWGGFGQGLP